VTFLVLLTTFVAGFMLRSNVELVAKLGFPVSGVEAGGVSAVTSKSAYSDISARISEVEDILSKDSTDAIDLDEDLVEATGDPYAKYFTQDRYEAYIKESLDSKYAGVGVLFSDYNGRAYAIDVLSGSEAEAKGVEQGDFVVAIDGDSSQDWTASEVIGALAKEKDSDVIITWMRATSLDASSGTEFTTTLECKTYNVVNVTGELRDDNVGYIKIKQITDNSATLVQDQVRALTSQGAEAFVLDVRDNPGGYLTQALDIASMFVPSGVLVEIRTKDGTSTRTSTGTTITSAPIVVLMNDYTSGAAEVLAAALADNNRATTVGQTTMGKGSVQVIKELSFGGAIRYTAAYYLTPQGHEITDVGITPDISISDSDDEGTDMQLTVALDSARSLIKE
jgi:carboxyl-terminal processing protease